MAVEDSPAFAASLLAAQARQAAADVSASRIAVLLAEARKGIESTDDCDDLDEADGDKAFGELRALIAEGPQNIRQGISRRLDDGRIDVPFCRVVRMNARIASKAKQTNKAEAFRRILQELLSLLEQASAPAPVEDRHAPRVDAVARPPAASSLAPRPLEASDLLDASVLRTATSDAGKTARRRIKNLGRQVAERLASCGWAVLDGLLGGHEVAAVRGEMQLLEPHFHASEIWVGHQAAVGAQMHIPDVRGDKILWMCGHHASAGESWSHTTDTQRHADFLPGQDPGALQPCSSTVRRDVLAGAATLKDGGARRVKPSERALYRNLAQTLDGMDALVAAVRESSAAGRLAGLADRSDAMLAVYPATGARFQRHVDNTAGDGRRLTVLCYMNDDWGPQDGGELCVFPSDGAPILIAPQSGRMALFHADTMPHEVLPARRHRYSMNVWYYDVEERRRAMAEATATGGRIGGSGGSMSDKDHAAARSLLQELLGGGAAGSQSPATAAELERLAARAQKLPAAAVQMVAHVAMGSAAKDVSAQDVAESLRAMAPSDLDQMRRSMSTMGRR